MATPRHSITQAVGGVIGRAHWDGWAAIALLVVPALVLAVAAFAGDLASAATMRSLAWIGLVALAVAGVALASVLAGTQRLAELARVLDQHGNGPVFVKDADCRYRYANAAAAELVGRAPADLVGRRDSDFDPGSAAQVFEENDRACLDRDAPTLFREVQETADGARVFLVSKYPLHDLRGRVAGLVGTARDITDGLDLQRLRLQRADEARVWFDQNPLPIVTFAASDQRIVDCNSAALRCYGYSRAALLRMRLPELFAAEEAERLAAYLNRRGHAVPPGSVAWTHRRAGGEAFAAVTDMGNLPHEDVPVRVMIVRDISQERAALAAARVAEARHSDLLESGLLMTWTHAADGRLLEVNSAAAEALGRDRNSMIGHALSEFVAEGARADWDEYLERTRTLRRDTGLLRVVSRSGEQRVWQYRFVAFPDAQPVPYVLGAAQDVTLQHRLEMRMRDQNRRDPLTGCATRHYLDVFAMQAAVDQPWGCVVVDIEYFRQLNDAEGRVRGDQVLRDLARLLAGCAGADDVVVRMGGDEFAILLPRTTTAAVHDLAERLGAASRDGMPAVFSIGWAVREAGEPVESTVRRADKQLLRNRACDWHAQR